MLGPGIILSERERPKLLIKKSVFFNPKGFVERSLAVIVPLMNNKGSGRAGNGNFQTEHLNAQKEIVVAIAAAIAEPFIIAIEGEHILYGDGRAEVVTDGAIYRVVVPGILPVVACTDLISHAESGDIVNAESVCLINREATEGNIVIVGYMLIGIKENIVHMVALCILEDDYLGLLEHGIIKTDVVSGLGVCPGLVLCCEKSSLALCREISGSLNAAIIDNDYFEIVVRRFLDAFESLPELVGALEVCHYYDCFPVHNA